MGFFNRPKGGSRSEAATGSPDLPTPEFLEQLAVFRGSESGSPADLGHRLSEVGQVALTEFGTVDQVPAWLLLLDLGVGEWNDEPVRSSMVEDMIRLVQHSPTMLLNVLANLTRVSVTEREGPGSPAHLRGAWAEFSTKGNDVDPTVSDDQVELGNYFVTRLDDAYRDGRSSGGWQPEPLIAAFNSCWETSREYMGMTCKTAQFVLWGLARAIADGQIESGRVVVWAQDRIVLSEDQRLAIPAEAPRAHVRVVPCDDADARLAQLGFDPTTVRRLRSVDFRKHIEDRIRPFHPSGALVDDREYWARLRAAAALLAPTSPAALESFRDPLGEVLGLYGDLQVSPVVRSALVDAAYSIMVPLIAAAEAGAPKLRQMAAMYLADLAESERPPDEAMVRRVVALFADGDFWGVSAQGAVFIEKNR